MSAKPEDKSVQREQASDTGESVSADPTDALSYLERIQQSDLSPAVKEIVRDVVETYGGYSAQALAHSIDSSDQAIAELHKRLDTIEEVEIARVDPNAPLNTLSFVDSYYDPTLFAKAKVNADELDNTHSPSLLSYHSGITHEEQLKLDNSTVAQNSSKNFYGNLHHLRQNVLTYLEDQGLSPSSNKEIAADTICKRVASVVYAYSAESAFVICSTFKPRNSPIPASTWHIDGPFDPLNTDPKKERKVVSTVFGADTDIYPDEHVHRQKLVEHAHISEYAWPRRMELEQQLKIGTLSEAEVRELSGLTQKLDEIQNSLEATVEPHLVTSGTTGDVHILRCSDPLISSFHRVPEIPSDRLFLQIYPLSAKSVAMVSWRNQIGIAEDLTLSYLQPESSRQ